MNPVEEEQIIHDLLIDSAKVKTKLAKEKSRQIAQVAEMIIHVYENNGKLLVMGNGGSAADSQHMVAELVHQYEKKGRKALPAIALTTNSSIITAIGNDWGYDQGFERQVEALATEQDVVIGITTSGNSPNIIKALEMAKSKGAKTITLAGKDGGKINGLADITIIVPSDNTARIQEAHIAIIHVLCSLIDEHFVESKL